MDGRSQNRKSLNGLTNITADDLQVDTLEVDSISINNITLNNGVANKYVKTDSNKKLVTTNDEPVITTGDQTISGTKTFNDTISGSINGNAGSVTNGVYTDDVRLTKISTTTASSEFTYNFDLSSTSKTTQTYYFKGNNSTIAIFDINQSMVFSDFAMVSGKKFLYPTGSANQFLKLDSNQFMVSQTLSTSDLTDGSELVKNIGNEDIGGEKSFTGKIILKHNTDNFELYNNNNNLYIKQGSNFRFALKSDSTFYYYSNDIETTGKITGNRLVCGGELRSNTGTIDCDNDHITTTGNITGAVITASTNFAGNLTGNVTGDLTGDVTGNCSGTSGSVTNGVYTIGNQTIEGTKTFRSTNDHDIEPTEISYDLAWGAGGGLLAGTAPALFHSGSQVWFRSKTAHNESQFHFATMLSGDSSYGQTGYLRLDVHSTEGVTFNAVGKNWSSSGVPDMGFMGQTNKYRFFGSGATRIYIDCSSFEIAKYSAGSKQSNGITFNGNLTGNAGTATLASKATAINTTSNGIVKTTSGDGTISIGGLVSGDIPNNSADTTGNADTATLASKATALNTTSNGFVSAVNSDGTISIGNLVSGDIPNNGADTTGNAGTVSNGLYNNQISQTIASADTTNLNIKTTGGTSKDAELIFEIGNGDKFKIALDGDDRELKIWNDYTGSYNERITINRWGAMTTQKIFCNNDFQVGGATDFKVTESNGNTVIGGTLDVAGDTTVKELNVSKDGSNKWNLETNAGSLFFTDVIGGNTYFELFNTGNALLYSGDLNIPNGSINAKYAQLENEYGYGIRVIGGANNVPVVMGETPDYVLNEGGTMAVVAGSSTGSRRFNIYNTSTGNAILKIGNNEGVWGIVLNANEFKLYQYTSSTYALIVDSSKNFDFQAGNLTTTGNLTVADITMDNIVYSGNDVIHIKKEQGGYPILRGCVIASSTTANTISNTYPETQLIGGSGIKINGHGSSLYTTHNVVYGYNHVIGSDDVSRNIYNTSNVSTSKQINAPYSYGNGIFGSTNYVNAGYTSTNNVTSASFNHDPLVSSFYNIVGGALHGISNLQYCMVGGRDNFIGCMNDYQLNLYAYPVTSYSIVCGYRIGADCPITAYYSAIFGRFHRTTEKSESTRSPATTGMYLPRRTNYTLMSGYNHTAKHDYVTLLGTGMTSGANGELRVSGQVHSQDGLLNNSDRRIKKDIVDASLDTSYDIVKNLKVRKYKYTDNYRKSLFNNPSDGEVWGFIAQEVEEIYPEAVKTDDKKELFDTLNVKDPNQDPDVPEPDEKPTLLETIPEFKNLEKQKLIYPMVGAIQKLMEKIETLEARIVELENK